MDWIRRVAPGKGRIFRKGIAIRLLPLVVFVVGLIWSSVSSSDGSIDIKVGQKVTAKFVNSVVHDDGGFGRTQCSL
jgi:hypothetical protein